MNYDDFFKLVEISEDEKESAILFMNLRSIEEHIYVAKYLQTFKKDKITYSEVASAFRYDKRIRRILYKYIGVIEEISKSYITNKYQSVKSIPSNALKKLSADEKRRTKNITSTYELMGKCFFITPLKMIEVISGRGEVKGLPFVNNYDANKRNALNYLRNQVNHNNFLLSNRNLSNVKLSNSEKSSTLTANIKNMITFLPEEMKEACIKEINNAHYKKDKKFKYQTEWKLIDSIIIKI